MAHIYNNFQLKISAQTLNRCHCNHLCICAFLCIYYLVEIGDMAHFFTREDFLWKKKIPLEVINFATRFRQ